MADEKLEKKEEKPIRKPITLDIAEAARNLWHLTPDNGHTVDDMLKTEYWANISRTMKSGDRIEVLPDDKHYFAEFFVLAAGPNWAKVVLMRECKLIEDNSPIEQSGYVVEFAGRHKWRVRNGNDILVKELDQEAAVKWLEEHLKTVK